MLRLVLIFGLGLALASPAVAEEAASLGPAVPKATGEPHPEGNDYMRRWHMTMMRHDRDRTMYEGDREVKASIGQCFDCHTVRDEAGTPVTVADERHFCRVCHDYAAVRIDCFDCHRSTPEDFEEPSVHAFNRPLIRYTPINEEAVAALRAYVGPETGTEAGR